MTTDSPLTQEIQELLGATRKAAEMYASADYRQPGQRGQSGLNMRFEALEEAVVRLAQAIDDQVTR